MTLKNPELEIGDTLTWREIMTARGYTLPSEAAQCPADESNDVADTSTTPEHAEDHT